MSGNAKMDLQAIGEQTRIMDQMASISTEDLQKFEQAIMAVFTDENIGTSKEFRRIKDEFERSRSERASKIKKGGENQETIKKLLHGICDEYGIDY